MKRYLLLALALLALGLIGVWSLGPAIVERQYNTLSGVPPYPVSARAATLQATLSLADLHADSLLWGRDLSRRGSRGHVDIPRLIEGRYALQVFSLSAKVPRNLNYQRNEDNSDVVTWLALVQRWPVAAWTSRRARALYEAQRLHEFASNHAEF